MWGFCIYLPGCQRSCQKSQVKTPGTRSWEAQRTDKCFPHILKDTVSIKYSTTALSPSRDKMKTNQATLSQVGFSAHQVCCQLTGVTLKSKHCWSSALWHCFLLGFLFCLRNKKGRDWFFLPKKWKFFHKDEEFYHHSEKWLFTLCSSPHFPSGYKIHQVICKMLTTQSFQADQTDLFCRTSLLSDYGRITELQGRMLSLLSEPQNWQWCDKMSEATLKQFKRNLCSMQICMLYNKKTHNLNKKPFSFMHHKTSWNHETWNAKGSSPVKPALCFARSTFCFSSLQQPVVWVSPPEKQASLLIDSEPSILFHLPLKFSQSSSM